MNSKAFEYITDLFDETVKKVTENPTDWIAFLKCASWNYNRRFDEQLLLFAQRPNATAIAQARTWSDPNKPYGRWVNKQEKGIPLFLNYNPVTGEKQGVAYYFDVEQTHETRSTKRPFSHWQPKEEYEEDLIETLENTFGVLASEDNLAEAVLSAAGNAAGDFFEGIFNQHYHGENIDEEARKIRLCDLMQNSIAYIMMSRLGIDADEHFSLGDFANIQYFGNDLNVFTIGNAIRDNAKVGLKAVAKTVLELDTQAKTRSNDYEHRNGRSESENTVQTGRGLFSSGLENATTAGRGTRQIRRTESEVAREEPTGSVHVLPREMYNGRKTVRERTESVGTRGKTYQPVFGRTRTDGRAEEERPVSLGGTDEQYQKASRGNSAERSSLQTLNKTEETQAEETKTSAFSIPQEIISDTLTDGTGFENGKYRIYEQYQKSFSQKENADFLRSEYGTGGWSETGGHKGYNCKTNSDGLTISHGYAENRLSVTLSWFEVAKQISDLIDDYAYLNVKEKEQYPVWLDNVQKKRAAIAETQQTAKDPEVSEAKKSEETDKSGHVSALVENETDTAVLENSVDTEENDSEKTEEVEEISAEDVAVPETEETENEDIQKKLNDELVGKEVVDGDRRFVIEKVNAEFGSVSMLDLSSSYPISRVEKLAFVRQLIADEEARNSVDKVKIDLEQNSGTDYYYEVGDLVYIGASEYKIDYLDDKRAVLRETEHPLYTKEFEITDFDRKVRENPVNDHLIANEPAETDYEDAFFVDRENQTVHWWYYNPDSNAGGQYVENRLDFDEIKDIKINHGNDLTADDFFNDYFASDCIQYCYDIATEDLKEAKTGLLGAESLYEITLQNFEGAKREFLKKPDFTDCSEETMNALIEIAEKETAINFDTEVFEKMISEKMRFKDVSVVNDNEICWVTQEIFTVNELKQFQNAFRNYNSQHRTNISRFYVTVRDLSSYNFDEDKANNVFATVTLYSIDANPYLDAIYTAGLDHYLEDAVEGEELYETEQSGHVSALEENETDTEVLENSVDTEENDSEIDEEIEVISADDVTVTEILPKQEEKPIVFSFHPEVPIDERLNFDLRENPVNNSPSQYFRYKDNIKAIKVLKKCETENRLATAEEQLILSKYVGWGGLSEVFDPTKKDWSAEYKEVKNLLDYSEYIAARESTLTAFYTPPEVVNAVYSVLEKTGFTNGNILEPSCGIGNFIGMLPENMKDSKVYGVELDSISARIAQQLYQKSTIVSQGFEKTDFKDKFFDVAVGNVPFGNFGVYDRRYEKEKFLIHDYFFAKTLDKVRSGGVVAFVTSMGTMDKKDEKVRRYIAQRADLLGAIRLPNNTFTSTGTKVTSDIILLQKRDRIMDIEPDWVHLDTDENGIKMNSYFVQNPQMVLGIMEMESGRYGDEPTCNPYFDGGRGVNLDDLLKIAVENISGHIGERVIEEVITDEDLLDEENDTSVIPADPSVRNYSFCLVDDKIYYRENKVMTEFTPKNRADDKRIRGMIAIRDSVRKLIDLELNDGSDEEIADEQAKLNSLYDRFYITTNSRLCDSVNVKLFAKDNSSALLQSLENTKVDEENKRVFDSKADIFTKRTIRPSVPVTHCETASEALSVSIGEKAKIDMEYMSELCGKTEEEIYNDLKGAIFLNPEQDKMGEEKYLTADEYLSGNIRKKIRTAQNSIAINEEYKFNLEELEKAKPKDLTAGDISVRLGSTWIPKSDIKDFIKETLHLSYRRGFVVDFSEQTSEWYIAGKSLFKDSVVVNATFGTKRKNALEIIEDTLNLKTVKVYDKITVDGKEKRVLNEEETYVAQVKQDEIKDKFVEWIWKDGDRRDRLCALYNEKFNCIVPRKYDGSHLVFGGINPEIKLRPHQLGAIAHILYGGNTLLAHCVGAGKTYEMIASAQESKRLGLCTKSLFVVPNHLIEQTAGEYMQLYPTANILVPQKEDFSKDNRKKFTSRIATGDYDAIIIGQSQFEKIPMSFEAMQEFYDDQIEQINDMIENLESDRRNKGSFTVKQLEAARKKAYTKLEKLIENNRTRKDDVVNFEELGVDRIYIDEAHYYKNLFITTKMSNVKGIRVTTAAKSEDLFMKCRYLDKLTGNRGIVFATGTPISNSMTELYTLQRYLQYDTLEKMGLIDFDAWISTFGETVTALELKAGKSDEYQSVTRVAKYTNLPELMSIFNLIADIQTADMLNLPVPKANYHVVAVEPSEIQKKFVEDFGNRADLIKSGSVSPKVDNMLKITNDGRKLGLDQRLLDNRLPDEEGSKVNACVKNIYDIWENTADKKSAQLLFCDISTPQADGSFSIYDDIKSKLVAKGIPTNEVRFIHEADTDQKKDVLFAQVRNGSVRVLLGSTQKMGAGTNVQDKLIALHDLDCPWRPSDLEQRSGRIIRQGNSNPEVDIFRYVTKETFDAYMFQTVENKQVVIGQIMTSKSPARVAEDIDDAALSYGEIKALATGNPLIKEKNDLEADIKKLRTLKSSYYNEKYAIEDQIRKEFPKKLSFFKERIEVLEKDLKRAQDNPSKPFSITIENKTYDKRETAGKELVKIIDSTIEHCTSEDKTIGRYRGFRIAIRRNYSTTKREYDTELTLSGNTTYYIEVDNDENAVGIVTRLENQINKIETFLETVKNQKEECEKNLAEAKENASKPFSRDEELKTKTARLNEVNAILGIGDSEKVILDDSNENTEKVEETKEKRKECAVAL